MGIWLGTIAALVLFYLIFPILVLSGCQQVEVKRKTGTEFSTDGAHAATYVSEEIAKYDALVKRLNIKAE